jgi:hypothetical protein
MAVIEFSRSRRMIALACALCGAWLASIPGEAARADDPSAPTEAEKLGEIGNRLANPLSDLWALSFSMNGPQFFDGNVNTGHPELGAAMLFQPVMPLPLYGEGEDRWKLITRPVIPFVFSTPIPDGFNEFDHKGGIGDIQLPLIVSPSERITGHFIFGAGPIFLLPSATSDDLGQQQWAMGPAVVLGYKTDKATFGVFPNYFWKIGEADQQQSTPNVSQMSLLYFFNYKLPEAWQVGFNPTISYNHEAPSDNKWNVPVGLYIGKTVRLGRLPVLIKAGGEYSVVSEDLFGLRFQFRLQITPVIPSLIQSPILGK